MSPSSSWAGIANLVCCGAAFLIAAAGAAGWLLEAPGLRSIVLGRPPMPPSAVLGLGLGAAALLFRRSGSRPPSWRWRAPGGACAAVVALLGGWTLLQCLTGRLGGSPLGPPSHAVASGLLLMGLSLLALHAFPTRDYRFSQVSALAAALIGGLALVGHAIRYDPFYQTSPSAGMGAPAAIGVVVLSLGILLARPEEGLVPLLMSPHHGGYISRRLLPLPLMLTLVLSGLGLAGARAGLYGRFTGIWLLQISNIIILSLLIWIAAAYIDRWDRGRRQAETELSRFFTLSLDMLCIAGTDGYFKRLNPAWEKALGFTRDELLARPYLELVHPEDRAFTMAAARNLTAGKEIISFENRYLCKDGSYKYLFWNAAPLPERGLIYAVAHDVTDRRRAEDKIRRMNLELFVTNQELELRNREVERATRHKSQFLASMSHELRTPLNAIIGFSDLLAQNTAGLLNAKQQRYVEHVRAAGRHLLQLINDILDLSKVEAGQLEWRLEDFSLAGALPEILSTITPLALKKKILLENEVPPHVIVHADRVRFKQILYNLLSNAVKFTPEGGRVRIEAGIEGPSVWVSVTDTGIGIALEEQAVIFEEFRQVGETATGVREGSGLGLAIVKRLVEGQGGAITVKSEPGRGSRFRFTLPAGSSSSPQPQQPGLTAKGNARRGEALILIVEEDAASQELLDSYLGAAGYRTATSPPGAPALDLARRLRPSAIALGLTLPGQNGWETLHQLKGAPATADIPVIVISAADQKGPGLTLGASDYLLKPVTRDLLVGAVERQVRRPGPATVLVVDDEPSQVELISSFLQAAGYTTMFALNGRQALAILDHTRPDAVLLDLVMPEINGFEVLQQIRQDPRCRGLPVLVLTAKDLQQNELEALRKCTEAVLSKQLEWKDALLERLHLLTHGAVSYTI
jgi:PAS domain S-box-containing protein